MKNHEVSHIHYTVFACSAEYGMSFATHFLPSLHMHHLGTWLGAIMFLVYTAGSFVYVKNSVATIHQSNDITRE